MMRKIANFKTLAGVLIALLVVPLVAGMVGDTDHVQPGRSAVADGEDGVPEADSESKAGDDKLKNFRKEVLADISRTHEAAKKKGLKPGSSATGGVDCISGCIFEGGLKGPTAEAKFRDLKRKLTMSPSATRLFAKIIKAKMEKRDEAGKLPELGQEVLANYQQRKGAEGRMEDLELVFAFFRNAGSKLKTLRAGTKIVNTGTSSSGEKIRFRQVLARDREVLVIKKWGMKLLVLTSCSNPLAPGVPGVPVRPQPPPPPPPPGGGKDHRDDVLNNPDVPEGITGCGANDPNDVPPCGGGTADEDDAGPPPDPNDPDIGEDGCQGGQCDPPPPADDPTPPPPDYNCEDDPQCNGDTPNTEDPPPDDGP